MRIRIWGARGVSVVAATAALSLAGTTAASAHHCYREQWRDAAYSQLSQGRTPWTPLSELGRVVIAEEIGLPQCAPYLTSEDLEPWLEDQGLSQEPLLQFRATVGGGAFYKTGKEPKPFNYLGDDDFAELEGVLAGAIEECMADE